MGLQDIDQGCDVADNPRVASGACPVLLAPDRRGQVLAPRHEFGKPRAVRVFQRGGGQFQRPAHPREKLCIHPVGLGQPAGKPHERAGLAGVDADVSGPGAGRDLPPE